MRYLEVKKHGINKGLVIGYNYSYNPETHDAISYNWWRFCASYNGYIIFNDYSYSSSTRRHQSWVECCLEIQGLKPDLKLYLYNGLNGDLETVLKQAVKSYLRDIKFCRSEIKTAVRAITRTKKRLEISYYRRKILKIIAILKGTYKNDKPSLKRYDYRRFSGYTPLSDVFSGNIEHLENDLDLKVSTWNDESFTIYINKRDIPKILLDDKIYKKSKSENLAKIRNKFLNLKTIDFSSLCWKTKGILKPFYFDLIKDKPYKYTKSDYNVNCSDLALYQVKNGVKLDDIGKRYLFFNNLSDKNLNYKSYKDLLKQYNLDGHKLEIENCFSSYEKQFIENASVLYRIKLILFYNKNKTKLNHDLYYKFLDGFKLYDKTSYYSDKFLTETEDIEKLKQVIKFLDLSTVLNLLKTCYSLNSFRDTINDLYYNFSLLDAKLDKLILRQISNLENDKNFCDKLHAYFIRREKRLKETEPRLLKPVKIAEKLDLDKNHDYKGYHIYIPKTLTEIRKIGRSQNHCIGQKSQNYIHRLESGYNNAIVLYLSKNKGDLKHGYTFYIENGSIYQANGFNNCRPDFESREIINSFISEKLTPLNIAA